MGLGVWSHLGDFWSNYIYAMLLYMGLFLGCGHLWDQLCVCILPYNSAWENASSWKEVIFSVHLRSN